MIRMINGSTYIDGQLVTAANGAFSASAETEKHLVEAGAAAYVNGNTGFAVVGAKASADPDNGFVGNPDNDPGGDGNFGIPEYSKNSSKAELQSIAKTYCVDFTENDTKEALAKKLDDFFADAVNSIDG